MADSHHVKRTRAPWRDKWYEVIFCNDTFAGRLFDVVLLTLILLSVLTVILESVPAMRAAHRSYFKIAEWVFTSLFTIENVARLISAKNVRRYATSFFGLVDLLAIARVVKIFRRHDGGSTSEALRAAPYSESEAARGSICPPRRGIARDCSSLDGSVPHGNVPRIAGELA